ncbi:MFS transporter [Planococcus plakortidis]|uniref:MFS transporter n=1 Tax=Planococcus plakortidis TaxID=1038856 RepID=A0A1C7EBU7_9BACL|nr:MFS transporter [Planococcus plakortidis]ANU21444.1 MFS transporter [Planococcus plakortidis]
MWKIVLPGIAMIGVTYAFARYSFGLFLPEISSALNLSESQSGLIGSVAYAAYTIALVTAAIFIHKMSARHVVLYLGASAFIGMLGMAASQGFYTLAISAFVAGLGSGWISPAFSQVVAQSLESQERDRGNTWINTGTSVGVVASGPVALAFAEQWRWGYVLFAILAFLTLWWNARAIERTKEKPKEAGEAQFKLGMLGQVRFMILAAIGIGFSSSIYWTFSRSYLTEAQDFSTGGSMVFWIIMGAAGIIGRIAGTIIQRLGLGWSYRLGVLVATASLVTLTIQHPAAIYLSAVLFGISFIFMTGLFIVWGTRHFPDIPSVGVSLSFFSLGIGQSIGSVAAGVLIDGLSYPIAFLSFAAIGLLFVFIKTNAQPVATQSNAAQPGKSV